MFTFLQAAASLPIKVGKPERQGDSSSMPVAGR